MRSPLVIGRSESARRQLGARGPSVRVWPNSRAGCAVAEVRLASIRLAERHEADTEKMPFTREQLRESFERAGFDEHWQALNRHHTEAYPESNPTPGQVAS